MYRHPTKLLLAGMVAAILTVAPAQAFHKGVVHGGGGSGEEPTPIQTLDSLACETAGEIAKWDGSEWVCAADTNTQLDAAGVVGLGFVTGAHTVDFDALADLSCSTDQIAKWDGLDWVCADGSGDTGPKTVFVTSTAYPGNLQTAGGALNGLTGADNLCQAKADSGKVQRGFYIAWLSTSTIDARDRLPVNTSGYFLPSGLKVANSKEDLLDGNLLLAIDEDENGDVWSISVWTGTYDDGTRDGARGVNTCSDWTSSSSSFSGMAGHTGAVSNDWTYNSADSCARSYRLYCFER